MMTTVVVTALREHARPAPGLRDRNFRGGVRPAQPFPVPGPIPAVPPIPARVAISATTTGRESARRGFPALSVPD